jgi:hypothetical protein
MCGIVLAVMVVQALSPFFNRRPFSKTWNPQKPGSCGIASLSLWRYMSTPNLLTTVMAVAIPLPALAKLQVSQSVKVGFVAVLLVCILGVVAAIMRLRAFLKVANFHNITFESVERLRWTVAEPDIYLVTGTMLTLKPLLKEVCKGGTEMERLLSDSSDKSRNHESRRSSRRWYQKEQHTALSQILPLKTTGSGKMLCVGYRWNKKKGDVSFSLSSAFHVTDQ